MIIFDIALLTKSEDAVAYHFGVPLRDAAVADVTIPEFEVDRGIL